MVPAPADGVHFCGVKAPEPMDFSWLCLYPGGFRRALSRLTATNNLRFLSA